LAEILDKKLFRTAAGLSTFRRYIIVNRQRFGFDYKKAEQIVKAAKIVRLIPPDVPKPVNLLHIMPLCHLKKDDVVPCWRIILIKGGDVSSLSSRLAVCEVERMLGKSIRYVPMVVDIQLGESQHNSNNWHTPVDLIDRVTAFFGGAIDLDPCSDSLAQGKIKALKYYSVADDGLHNRNLWSNNVFVNPPYSLATGNAGFQELFLDRALSEMCKGTITQCVLLLKAAVGAKWFRKVFDLPHGFLKDRVQFGLNGQDCGKAQFGSVLVYIGPNVDGFVAQFKDLAFFPGVNSWGAK
jgi:hypothetical protein